MASAGVMQVDLYHAAGDLASGRLQRVLADLHEPDERKIARHYAHQQFLRPRVRVVVDALLAHRPAAPILHFKPAPNRSGVVRQHRQWMSPWGAIRRRR